MQNFGQFFSKKSPKNSLMAQSLPLISSPSINYGIQEDEEPGHPSALSESSPGPILDTKHSAERAIDKMGSDENYHLLERSVQDNKKENLFKKRWVINPDFNESEVALLQSLGFTVKTKPKRNGKYYLIRFFGGSFLFLSLAAILKGIDMNDCSHELQDKFQSSLGNVTCKEYVNNTFPSCNYNTSAYPQEFVQTCNPLLIIADDCDNIAGALGGAAVYAMAFCLITACCSSSRIVGNLSSHSKNILGQVGLSPRKDEDEQIYKKRLLANICKPDVKAHYQRISAQFAVFQPLAQKFDAREVSKWQLPCRHRSELAGITKSPLFTKDITRLIFSLGGIAKPSVPLEPKERFSVSDGISLRG